jgi:hypothetical protein
LEVAEDASKLLPLFEMDDSFGLIENIQISGEEQPEVIIAGDLVLYYSLPLTDAGKISDELPKKAITDQAMVERMRALECTAIKVLRYPWNWITIGVTCLTSKR